MPPKMPRLDDLLALLQVFFALRLQEGRRPRQSLRRKVVFRHYPLLLLLLLLLLPISSSRLTSPPWAAFLDLSDAPILFHPPRPPARKA
ncbi:hypothetical protein H9Q69_001791 [Fusarium xylarioides]|uniref:Uncharacterized protein n=1 Tax=Fusarium xylarioides TaxID=221167 RepID=A0A9P7KXH4_9HYPO|nr:hypothetical protein H9Q72_010936 [Fusarium xylarioides]KAG5799159.1 hypothetical protein H9Q69_001791 [Fusarium xylarioides]